MAGNWRTWTLTSGRDFRVPPPPDLAATRNEIAWLKTQVALEDPVITDQVNFWDAGSPGYRWIENMIGRSLAERLGTVVGQRLYPWVAVAMYDATIAAWDSKYFYNRARPSVVDPSVTTRLAVPASPSYPSEHAAVAAGPPRLPSESLLAANTDDPPHFSRRTCTGSIFPRLPQPDR
jgi:hypothetical protein